MASSTLALAAVAGTALLAVIEAVARLLTSRATRGRAGATVGAVAASGGVALVVAAIATVDVGASTGLLAAASAGIALLVAGVVGGIGGRRD